MFLDDMKDQLTNGIIPFWKNLKDPVHGGYYGLVDYDLHVDKEAVKGCILNSRILWFFSNAYTHLGDRSLLDAAGHAYSFLKDHFIEREYGGVHWSVNYDGSVHDSMKHTYNQAFAIYALASYYEASKDTAAKEQALEIFSTVNEKCSINTGFLEALDRTFQNTVANCLSDKGGNAEMTMNTLLHLFEAVTELYRVTRDEKVEACLRRLLDMFEGKIYNPALRRLEVFFDRDMNSLIDSHSYGHDIEAAWLLDRGCEVLGDEAYIKRFSEMTAAITKRIYERAYVKDSVIYECIDGVDNGKRVWWAQAEAVVGFLNGYQRDPSHKEYLEAALHIWSFIKKYLLDTRPGSEWFTGADEDGAHFEGTPIADFWKCPYHNGRMCLEALKRNIDIQ